MFLNKKKTYPFELVEKFEQIFYINYLMKGMTVFDVGANIGELTLLFSKFISENGVVHSFEPTPQTFEKLKMITAIAGRKNVVLNQFAVSNIDGYIDFNVYKEEFSCWNTSANRPLANYGIDLKPETCISVPTITIDSYCKQHNIERIDLLKVDVEGAEINVLEGAKKMFRGTNIGCCVFEFGQTLHDMGRSSDDLKKFFRDVNYSVSNVVKHQILFPVDNKTGIAQFAIHIAKPR
jgi:FkbM family methyltransferase